MARKSLPSADYVRECLDYNPETGQFRWRKRPRGHFKNNQVHSAWNTHYADTVAGGYNTFGHIYIRLVHHLAAHRLAWLLVYGEPVPYAIDHIDCDPANNRIDNLRAATPSGNMANSGLSVRNTTGIRGIRVVGYRFSVQITCHGVRHCLGTFGTIEEASEVRRAAAERLYGKFARHE